MLPTEPGPQAGQNRIFEGIGPLSQSWFDIFDRLLLSVSRQEVGGLHSTTQPDGVCVCVCVCLMEDQAGLHCRQGAWLSIC